MTFSYNPFHPLLDPVVIIYDVKSQSDRVIVKASKAKIDIFD